MIMLVGVLDVGDEAPQLDGALGQEYLRGNDADPHFALLPDFI